MTKTICTTISEEFFNLCKENNIKWSEAIRIGIAVLLGEKGVRKYKNTLNMQRMITASRIKAEEALTALIKQEECQTQTTSKEEEKSMPSVKP